MCDGIPPSYEKITFMFFLPIRFGLWCLTPLSTIF